MADNSPAAFPISADPCMAIEQTGMSLRDYFAARALDLQVLQNNMATSTPYKSDHQYHGLTVAQVIAKEAYEIADAMLEARKSNTPAKASS